MLSYTTNYLTSKFNLYLVFSKLCYPVIAFIVGWIGYSSLITGADLGLSSFITVFVVMAYFIVMERIIPFNKSWLQTKKEWSRDSICFVLVIIYGALSEGIVRLIALSLAVDENNLSLWQNAGLGILLSSFIGYWLHRLEHRHLWLWAIHGIHHVPNTVSLTNNSVVHVFEVLLSAVVTQSVLLLCGISGEGMFIAGLFTILQGYFIHANVSVQLGFLNHVIATPELHRFHHSTSLTQAGNFGSDLSIWDKLFSTFYYRKGDAPETVGVVKPYLFPSSFQIHKGIFHPFKWYMSKRGYRPRYINGKEKNNDIN
ncbi:sterol desaturase family protein [Colwellia psychrerythraea]|uniref:Fatty acid hydroxylase n=1 Tax=Colwellia psychrerythraea TaxID=28229 RepID=A0A099KN26_COLPS|nr:sterol desaturase family protein [Colwellia psychrerythraea]KGJ91891.1 fatty acid hydroxylase [Colwellia psychrerythraea]